MPEEATSNDDKVESKAATKLDALIIGAGVAGLTSYTCSGTRG